MLIRWFVFGYVRARYSMPRYVYVVFYVYDRYRNKESKDILKT